MPQPQVTRQQFKDNVVTGIAWEPLPWWLQSGAFGWPMPYYHETQFNLWQEALFAIEFGAIPTVVWTMEDAWNGVVDRFRSFFQTQSGSWANAQDMAEGLAVLWENFVAQDEECEANGWSPWAEEN